MQHSLTTVNHIASMISVEVLNVTIDQLVQAKRNAFRGVNNDKGLDAVLVKQQSICDGRKVSTELEHVASLNIFTNALVFLKARVIVAMCCHSYMTEMLFWF